MPAIGKNAQVHRLYRTPPKIIEDRADSEGCPAFLFQQPADSTVQGYLQLTEISRGHLLSSKFTQDLICGLPVPALEDLSESPGIDCPAGHEGMLWRYLHLEEFGEGQDIPGIDYMREEGLKDRIESRDNDHGEEAAGHLTFKALQPFLSHDLCYPLELFGEALEFFF